MPSCPECGFDVEEPGLCAECRKEKERKSSWSTGARSIRNHARKPAYPGRERIIIVVLLMLVAGEAGFILGRELNRGQADSQRPDNPSPSAAFVDDTSVYNPFPPVNENEESGNSASATAELPSAYDLRERSFDLPLEDEEEFVKWTLANRPEEEYYVRWRWDCAQDLLNWESIKTERILEAFLLTPREKFIRERNVHLAYEHKYLPIGYGATITDPWVVSIMTQAINPAVHHKVLEIGTGSGYQAAILSELSNHVYTIEIIEELLEETDLIYREMEKDYPEYANILRKADDGYFGWLEYAPFDRIIVTCGIDHIPPDLLKQLAPGGIMVIPVGPPSGQTLMKVVKRVDQDGTIFFDREKIMSVKFIPFVTKEGKIRERETP